MSAAHWYGSAAGEAPAATHAQYEATAADFGWKPAAGPVMHGPLAKKKLDGRSLVIAFAVPYLIFVLTFVSMCYGVRHDSPGTAYGIAAVLLCLAFLFGCLAADVAQRRRRNVMLDPTWFLFIFVTSLLAWGLGLLAGDQNYTTNLKEYYDYIGLRRVSNVDPGAQLGKELMDAGTIQFAPGSSIDTAKSMAYREGRVYCVAPIVSYDQSPLLAYDFWAVGVDCCSSAQSNGMDFQCGDVFSSEGGLRNFNDADRSYFLLAVMQAEAKYGIHSSHPIFINWMPNPAGRITDHRKDGDNFSYWCCGAYFAIQALLVAIAAMLFSRATAPHQHSLAGGHH